MCFVLLSGVQTRSPLSQLREASFRETPVKEIRHDTVAHYLASSTSPPFLAYHASEVRETVVCVAVCDTLLCDNF